MFSRLSSLCLLAVAGISFACVGQLRAQLASKSPFMPAHAAPTTGPTAGAPLEFRGYIGMGDDVQYRIFDPAKKTFTWVKLNQRDADFDVVAKQHDESGKTLVIEHQGKTLTLAMREAKVVSSGSAAQALPPPPPMLPPSNVAPAVTQSVVLNPTPAQEQQRLEAVASEVARRRALREQATQQINQGVAPQVVIPQPPQPQPQQQRPQGNSPQNMQTNPRSMPNDSRRPGPQNRQR